MSTSEPKTSPVEEEEEEPNLYGLFVSESYVPKTFEFGDHSQTLLCSPMSSTDYDLTGQIIWPASLILTWFLRNRILQQSLFKNRSVLELGAGCGLAGFYLATHGEPRHVEITDGNEIVCRLLEKNREFTGFATEDTKNPASTTLSVRKLLWGLKSELHNLWRSPDARFPDYLVGADIILWPNQIRSLLHTIRWSLFARLAQAQRAEEEEKDFEPKAFVSYVVRAHSTTTLLFSTASELGLSIVVVLREEFVPEECHTFDSLQTMLFVITLSSDEVARGCDFWNEEALEIEEQNRTSAMPC